ncbi:MFS transporter [Burkholderia plantarii]|uniref:MFS transporter n=1 Tax=Burkholderia plantarii TaxID=41899 RepID=UPI00272BB703|nr:MFS transporter [Burkholderia plantarii]WLE59890.1 MFS transporter [Burkholderia plantarii]
MNPGTRDDGRLGAHLVKVVATTSISFVVTQLDVTIVNVALVPLGASLRMGVAQLQWVVDAYTLVFAVCMLSAGMLGDRLGARRVFMGGIALFALASLGGALSNGAALLIAARAWQGLGAAVMLPTSLALLSEACGTRPTTRARAVGLWTAAGAISIAAGPVVGGFLIAACGWRGIFLVNLPLCAAGLVAAWAWLPSDRGAAREAEGGGRAAAPRRFNLTGQLLAMLSLLAVTHAFIEWQRFGLAHPRIWGSLAAGMLAGALLVAHERRSRAPLLPPGLFATPVFAAAVGFGMCMNLAYYGTVFVLSLYLQRVLGYAPLQAGIAFLPLTGGFLVSNVASGWIAGAFGARVPMAAGAVIALCGYAMLGCVGGATTMSGLLLPFLLIPGGMGLAVPAMTSVVLAQAERRHAGTASAALNTARQAAGAIGVAGFGALAGGGALHVVAGLRVAAAIAVALMLVAAALAGLVRTREARVELSR